MLRQAFVPLNLSQPGLRVLNVDPPVFTIADFVSDEICDQMVAAAAGSRHMEASRVGGTAAAPPPYTSPPPASPQQQQQGGGGGGAYGSGSAGVRTSSTLAMTQQALDAAPALRGPLEALLDAACRVVDLQQLGQDPSALRKSLFSRPTAPGQVAPELPQVAHYLPGQHFLAHEDAFPGNVALQKGYQRRATVLCYLNDVPQGGATKFELLNLAVQPRKGMALIFFPAFSGGAPDARTLHTAEDAAPGFEKWVFQLWLVSSLTMQMQAQRQQQSKTTKKKRR